MMRVVIAVLLFLAVSSNAIAQTTTTLPKVEVTALRIGGITLCEGLACSDLFSAIIVPPPLVVEELSDVGPTEPNGPECSGIDATREYAVWTAYKAALLLKYGLSLIGQIQMASADRASQGTIATIEFSNGASGQYQRSDSALSSTHGFFEIVAPKC